MKEIILIGNPNTGKTTLFNTLTKSHEKASNWHGVTVGVKSKKYFFKNEEFLVTDLPGLYSLNGFSNEEKIASDYLLNHKDALIVNICDANNLERNFKLTHELLKLRLNILIAVNMCNEVKLFDYDKMQEELDVKIIEIDARKFKDINKLKSAIFNIFYSEKSQKIAKSTGITSNFDAVLKNYKIKNIEPPYKKTDKIDRFVLNKIIFIPLFIVIIFLVFYITFGPFGSWLSSLFNVFFNWFIEKLQKIILCMNMSNIVKCFLCEGIFNAIGSVLSFIPQIVLLLFFMNLLEDSGLMSRIAFMFDGLLRKVGLTGKSLFSIFLGFGCTTSAILTTRNLENENLRKRTVLLLPFSSCSAKLPVYLVVASLFFEKYKYLFVFLLYVFSILISLLFAVILKKYVPSKNDVFIMEMPKYRLPSLKKVFEDIWVIVKDFLIKVGTTILFFSALVWLAQNISVDFKFLNGENFNRSILYAISNFIAPVFKFVGLDNPGIVCVLFLGLIAKEMIIVGLAMINGVAGSLPLLTQSLMCTSSVCSFTLISSIVFLIFVLIYSPCISALVTVKNELGIKTSIFVFVFQFILAYVVSFVVYRCMLNLNFLFFILGVILLVVFVSIVLKLKKRKSLMCRGNCSECGKI